MVKSSQGEGTKATRSYAGKTARKVKMRGKRGIEVGKL